MSDSFYITTAISYVNAKPHLGHAYEFIASDVIARYQRMLGKNVFFLSGVDEHSAKVEKAAAEREMTPAAYCDEMSVVFRDLHEKLNTSLDGYIRTSEPRHHQTTKELLQRAYDKGDIYQSKYSGWYCESCEAYYPADELEEEKCPVHKQPAKWLEEDNYFFRLSNYTDALKKYFEENPTFTQPDWFKNEILALLDRGLQDISISRSTTKWGIPLPWDPEHVAYVWFDALSNYLTGVGFLQDDDLFNTFWPADIHVIGKDITRFHSALWPAMLMSTDIALPKQVLVHGFIYHRGEKMSKTIGNIVDPLELLETYGCDPLRYFLMREIAFGQDGNYSIDALIGRYNADLANDIGNLFSRTLAMVKKYRGKVVPEATTSDLVQEKINQTIEVYQKNMSKSAIHTALGVVWELIGFANRYVDESQPWALAKDESKEAELNTVLFNMAEMLRVAGILVHPVMPEKSAEMIQRLGLSIDASQPKWADLTDGKSCANATVDPGAPLFPRLETKEQ